MSTDQRRSEVLARLARVVDPELDETVTELGFVTDVRIDAAGVVQVDFRLPTYWCAANFAFLMAEDMRRETMALPWVTRAEIRLGEHMYAEKINRGMSGGLSFQEAFGEEAAGGLEALRRTFLVKAFQRRQLALLRHLQDCGHHAAAIVAMSRTDLAALPLVPDGQVLRARYLDRRDVIDLAELAFVDADGGALQAAELPAYLTGLARVGINTEFNGAICRGLMAVRFNETPRAVA